MQAVPQQDKFLTDTKLEHLINVAIQLPPLIPSQYLVSIWVGSHNTETLDEVKEAVMFEIQTSPMSGRSFLHTIDHGYIIPVSTITKMNSSLY